MISAQVGKAGSEMGQLYIRTDLRLGGLDEYRLSFANLSWDQAGCCPDEPSRLITLVEAINFIKLAFTPGSPLN